MAKLVLNDITKLDNNAITLLNDNFTKLEAAIENTLSRDGLTPNTMASVLDMNSSKVINSSPPTAGSDLARLVDVNTATEGSQVALLRTELGNTAAVGEGDALIGHKNTNYTGTTGRTLHDKLNDIVVNAKDFPGVSGTDYTVPINNAITALTAAGGGRLEIPAGATISSQILITSSNIHLHFEGNCTATFTTKQCMFLFQGTVGTRLQNILVTGPTAILDGNGANITGYTYDKLDDA